MKVMKEILAYRLIKLAAHGMYTLRNEREILASIVNVLYSVAAVSAPVSVGRSGIRAAGGFAESMAWKSRGGVANGIDRICRNALVLAAAGRPEKPTNHKGPAGYQNGGHA